jgi:hypothetical protein
MTSTPTMTSTPKVTSTAMAPRPEGAAVPVRNDARLRTPDEQWNQQVSRLMHEAAEEREHRERARATEDDLHARREAAALMALIRARVRPDGRARGRGHSRAAGRETGEMT